MHLPDPLAAEVAALHERYGPTTLIEAAIPNGLFDPVRMDDRFGEVCMVIRRPSGRLLTARKTFYPEGAFRLLTGGIRHGEAIEAALAREVAEETSLSVAVRRLLAVIAYTAPETPPGRHAFYSFAFLLDELGGTLAVQDLDEQVAAFGEVEPGGLAAMADALAALEHREDRAIGGSWRNWGTFRAVVHRVVGELLTAPEAG